MNRLLTRRLGPVLAVILLLSLLSGCGLSNITLSRKGGKDLPRRMNYQQTAPIDMVKFS